MLKIVLVVVVTALLAFAAGVWTKSTVLATGAATLGPATLSPSEMHLRVNPQDLPIQRVDDYN
jgi:hypothetical protein